MEIVQNVDIIKTSLMSRLFWKKGLVFFAGYRAF